jgi:hypothetical protein
MLRQADILAIEQEIDDKSARRTPVRRDSRAPARSHWNERLLFSDL